MWVSVVMPITRHPPHINAQLGLDCFWLFEISTIRKGDIRNGGRAQVHRAKRKAHSAKRKVIGYRRLKRVRHRDEATGRRCFLFFNVKS